MELIFSTGVEVGSWGLDISVGYGRGWANKVTYGESMAYAGSVACIADEDTWMKKKYSWGMFVQDITPSTGFSYQLVHYYTEGDFSAEKEETDIIGDISGFIEENPTASLVGGVCLLAVVFLVIRRIRR